MVIDKTSDFVRENATFLVLCRNDELYELLETLQLFEDRFNRHYGYDYTFLNDQPFTSDFIEGVAHFLPHGKLSFGHIAQEHWLYPLWVDQALAAQKRAEMVLQDVVYGGSELYRHMCRFYLGFFHLHPLVQQYRYYWRVEPGVRLFCDVNYDVFRFMRTRKKTYGFALLMFEYEKTVPSLWAHFQAYLSEKKILVETNPLLSFVQNDNAAHSYNLCHFWLNFEIADLGFFRSTAYTEFFRRLDATGGFFYERWGDAPVHTLAIAALLDPSDLWWFGDMGYRHDPYEQCPQDPAVRVSGRCSCDPDRDFSFGFLSCTAHALAIMEALGV